MFHFLATLPLLVSGLVAASLDDLTWSTTESEVTIVSCAKDASGNLDIPAMIAGIPVTMIGDSAFQNCGLLTQINLPTSLATIGEAAFSGCDQLTSFSIPNKVSTIGKSAFARCYRLEEITLPAELTEIAEGVFSNSGLSSIVIPEGVLKIGNGAFNFCVYLMDIRLPASLTFIDNYAFGSCYSLTHLSIPDNVTWIGDFAFHADPSDWAETLGPGLQKVFLGKRVAHIGRFAFWGQFGTENSMITIPASTTFIGLDGVGASTAFFDGPAPDIEFVTDDWDLHWPTEIAHTIHVWPKHLESFDKDHQILNLSKIVVRDTSPAIASLTLEDETVTVSITGAPDMRYICKTSDELMNFSLVETNPEILTLDSSGKMDFTIQASRAGKFFVIEESP